MNTEPSRLIIDLNCPAQGQTGPKGESGVPGPPGPPVSKYSDYILQIICLRLHDWRRSSLYPQHLSVTTCLLPSVHDRALPVMSSTHFPSKLPSKVDHVGTSTPASWWTKQPPTPTIRTTTTAWRKSLAPLTHWRWRSSRWSTHWAHRPTLHEPARTCSSAILISLMVCIMLNLLWWNSQNRNV